jgi:hypothetical protein
MLEISDQDRARLGESNYRMLRGVALAAVGEYGAAEEAFAGLAKAMTATEENEKGVGLYPRDFMALYITREVLDGPSEQFCLPAFIWRQVVHQQYVAATRGITLGLRRKADVTVLRGLVALEEGDVEQAETAFREALLLWGDEVKAASGAGLDFNGRAVAQGYLEWLK